MDYLVHDCQVQWYQVQQWGVPFDPSGIRRHAACLDRAHVSKHSDEYSSGRTKQPAMLGSVSDVEYPGLSGMRLLGKHSSISYNRNYSRFLVLFCFYSPPADGLK